jgi:replicative DNA helicase
VNAQNAPVQPPYSHEAEQAVLAGLMIDPSYIDIVKTIIQPDDMFMLRHKQLYAAILDLHHAGQPTDILMVADYLEKKGTLAALGGPAYLVQLGNSLGTAMHTQVYAQVVAVASKRRHMARLADSIRDAALNEAVGLEQSLPQIDAQYKTVMARSVVSADSVPFEAHLDAQFSRIEAAAERQRQGLSISEGSHQLPLVGLEAVMGQIYDQSVVTWAGRPGKGKSSILHAAARFYAKKDPGAPLLLFTREMPVPQVVDAMMAQECRIPLDDLRKGRMSPEVMARYVRHYGEMAKLNIDIDDRTMYWEDMVNKILKVHREQGVKFIMFDYLKLIRTRQAFSGDSGTRLRMAHIMTEAKQLAVETNAVIFMATQINREGASVPTLETLKDTGAIEEDSDVVIAIHNDHDSQQQNPGLIDTQMIVLKNRHGPTGTARVGFHGMYKLFVDVASDNRPAQASSTTRKPYRNGHSAPHYSDRPTEADR